MGSTLCRADVVLLDGEKKIAIVECKGIGDEKPEGIGQLKSYLSASNTRLGVFANDTDPSGWMFLRNLGEDSFDEINRSEFETKIGNIRSPKRTQVSVVRGGDITEAAVGAIVNPTNELFMGRGGLDRKIQQAGGDALDHECRRVLADQGRLETGRAVLTLSGGLRASYVIHTAGPHWRGGKLGEPELLASCYEHCLQLAAETGIRSIAFPSISTGHHNYPIEDAARVALTALKAFVERAQQQGDEVPEHIYFYPFSGEAWNHYKRILSEPEFEHYFTLSEG